MRHYLTTTLLIVLDGWGYGEPGPFNAIDAARTPIWDHHWTNCPHTLLACSGGEVGLPAGQMGNSEVGHMAIGAGRVVDQDLTRVDKSIADRTLFSNPAVRQIKEHTDEDHHVHIMGLLSPGGVHSHENHIWSIVEHLANSSVQTRLHAFLDGRDTPPKSALQSLAHFEERLADYPQASIASICGRFYAMDRDGRWDRTKSAYDLLLGSPYVQRAVDSVAALHAAYDRGETDEFVQPTRTNQFVPIQDGDTAIFMNFRADRARQLSRAFVLDDFQDFHRFRSPRLKQFVTLTKYADDINSSGLTIPVATLFGPQRIRNTLGECLANADLKQLRIAESEKSAHVTYFFSGGVEHVFEKEYRCIFDSLRVSTYDQQPRMRADAIADEIVDSLLHDKYSVVICNFANGDMVGHTGNFHAAVAAVECLDECLGRILEACKRTASDCFITADHGNVENMFNRESDQPDTAHTNNLVPFLYVGSRDIQLVGPGVLSDVAPTILDVMNLPIPAEMTGNSLIRISH